MRTQEPLVGGGGDGNKMLGREHESFSLEGGDGNKMFGREHESFSFAGYVCDGNKILGREHESFSLGRVGDLNKVLPSMSGRVIIGRSKRLQSFVRYVVKFHLI